MAEKDDKMKFPVRPKPIPSSALQTVTPTSPSQRPLELAEKGGRLKIVIGQISRQHTTDMWSKPEKIGGRLRRVQLPDGWNVLLMAGIAVMVVNVVRDHNTTATTRVFCRMVVIPPPRTREAYNKVCQRKKDVRQALMRLFSEHPELASPGTVVRSWGVAPEAKPAFALSQGWHEVDGNRAMVRSDITCVDPVPERTKALVEFRSMEFLGFLPLLWRLLMKRVDDWVDGGARYEEYLLGRSLSPAFATTVAEPEMKLPPLKELRVIERSLSRELAPMVRGLWSATFVGVEGVDAQLAEKGIEGGDPTMAANTILDDTFEFDPDKPSRE